MSAMHRAGKIGEHDPFFLACEAQAKGATQAAVGASHDYDFGQCKSLLAVSGLAHRAIPGSRRKKDRDLFQKISLNTLNRVAGRTGSQVRKGDAPVHQRNDVDGG